MTEEPEDDFRIEVTPAAVGKRCWNFFESVLSEEQRLAFYEEGYIILRNEIPKKICELARKHINMSLAEGDLVIGV